MPAPKIMTVFGTRPEAIKVAPVIKALDQDDRFESVPVPTGQHKEMLEQVNSMFGISRPTTWGLMKPGQGLNELVSRALVGLDVVTTYRREILDAMKNIGDAVADLAAGYPGTYFVLPLHLNPKVRRAVLPEVENLDNVIITNPLPYDQFTQLQNRASIILTDSGGVQEEAPALGKPVLVMRSNTERPEAVVAGTVKLVGTECDLITAEARLLLEDDAAYAAMANAVNPYGDGQGAARSVAAIANLFDLGDRLPDFAPPAVD